MTRHPSETEANCPEVLRLKQRPRLVFIIIPEPRTQPYQSRTVAARLEIESRIVSASAIDFHLDHDYELFR